MGKIAVIGEAVRTTGFGLAGAMVFETASETDVIAAWNNLPDDVVTVVLTPVAAAVVNRIRVDHGGGPVTTTPYTVVMPP